ncbi:hypothetical protein FBUS_10977 [Fasciolopsis buskii]|uniref:Uncharacterized protein n=1 Tax=Fasciolopsis buskii TaxID=27845 RepID=A0A8E0RNN7_9TREM|nr:hypothetical protein FBUS_10977 [Fasciolopsis buski]
MRLMSTLDSPTMRQLPGPRGVHLCPLSISIRLTKRIRDDVGGMKRTPEAHGRRRMCKEQGPREGRDRRERPHGPYGATTI